MKSISLTIEQRKRANYLVMRETAYRASIEELSMAALAVHKRLWAYLEENYPEIKNQNSCYSEKSGEIVFDKSDNQEQT